MEQRLAFDQIANVYRTARPGYPEALVEDVVSYADLKQNDKILEVGCGTGQATKSFAQRSFLITAIDPGPEMIRGARESLAGFSNVEFLQTTFEGLSSKQGEFRLVIAAQSWHWVSPEMRFAKAAQALSPEGSLAVFGHVPVGLPASLLTPFKKIYLRQTGKWGPPPEAWYLPNGPFKGWFEDSGLFGPVDHRKYSWKWRHTTSSYTNFLRTRSEHQMMEPVKLGETLREIANVIDIMGGEFTMDYETHLYIARRLNRV